MISGEWVQTVATGIPALTGAGVIVWGQGWLWRRWLWDAHGAELSALSAELGGPIRPTWTGWRIDGRDARITLAGGLSGVTATGRRGGSRVERPDLAGLRRWIREGP